MSLPVEWVECVWVCSLGSAVWGCTLTCCKDVPFQATGEDDAVHRPVSLQVVQNARQLLPKLQVHCVDRFTLQGDYCISLFLDYMDPITLLRHRICVFLFDVGSCCA